MVLEGCIWRMGMGDFSRKMNLGEVHDEIHLVSPFVRNQLIFSISIEALTKHENYYTQRHSQTRARGIRQMGREIECPREQAIVVLVEEKAWA